ncbi:MAG: aminopeptidase [Thermoplasmata archaeon]
MPSRLPIVLSIMDEGKRPTEQEEMARNVLKECLRVRRGESVLIEAWTESLEYAEAFQLETRRLGAHPLMMYESDSGYWKAYEEVGAAPLGVPSRAEWAALRAADAYVYFWGPSDRARLQSMAGRERERLTAFNAEWYRVARSRRIRGARMEIARAIPANAQARGVDLNAWRQELNEATKVPPRSFARLGRRLMAALGKGRLLRLTHPNGTDLTLGLKHRRVQMDDGIVDAKDLDEGENMATVPGGDLLTAVDESVAEGILVSNAPSWLGLQHRLEGGRWEFRGGRLISFDYGVGGEEFSKAYEAAPRGKERPALFEMGLNPALRDSPLLEDQALGAATVYIGMNQAYGGSGRGPFSAYLIVREASLTIDGTPRVRSGKIL